ncbi:MAG: hypothetical protein ACTSP3_05905 [Candidatus Heimdallarchaeaceae archaeon]
MVKKAYDTKFFLILSFLNIIILLSQISIYATKPSYYGNAAFEPDQAMIVNGTLNMIRNMVLEPKLLSSPAFSFYLILPLFLLIYLIRPQAGFSVYIITERFFSILIGHIFLIVFFNIIDKIIKNRKIKIITFSFICLNGLNENIIQGFGRYIDVLMLLFISLTAYYAIIAFEENNNNYFYLSILFSVLSVSSKLPGLLTLVVVLFGFLPIYHFLVKSDFKQFLVQFGISLLLVILVFFILNPYFLLEPQKTWEGLFYQYTLVKEGYVVQSQPTNIYFKHIFIYQGSISGLIVLLSYAGSLLLLIYTSVKIVKRKSVKWSYFIISTFSLAYFIVFPIFFSVYMVRYILPSLQFAFVVFGIFTENISLSLKHYKFQRKNLIKVVEKSKKIVIILLYLCILIILTFSLSRALYFNVSYFKDTRHVASQWMLDNISLDSKILSSAYFYVPEDFENTRIQWAIDDQIFQDYNPQYLCVSSIQYSRVLTINQSLFYENLFAGKYNVTLLIEFTSDTLSGTSIFNPLASFYLIFNILKNLNYTYGPSLLIYEVHNTTLSI